MTTHIGTLMTGSSLNSLLLLAATTTPLLLSCGGPNGSNQNTPDDEKPALGSVELRRAALTDVADGVIIPQYADFAAEAKALTQATLAWSEEASSQEKREAAKEAWREAMTSWQHAEVTQVGPAGEMGSVAGGEDLRSTIYSWPLVNPCRVDQELARDAFMSEGFFPKQLVNVRGLDAIEYALFYDEEMNSCAPTSSVNRDGSWDKIEDVTARRAAFAYAATRDLEAQALELARHWSADGGNFRAEFIEAGALSQTYGSTQEALNALSDAMFYLEKETKDMKLAIPAGQSKCAKTICPEELEHPFADFALEASLANHRAFERLYLGHAPGEPEAKGFDDLLLDMGQDELDAEIKQKIAAAIAAHEAIDGTLSEALEDDLGSVVALFEASRDISVLLKTQFVSVLDLEVPQRAAGDND